MSIEHPSTYRLYKLFVYWVLKLNCPFIPQQQQNGRVLLAAKVEAYEKAAIAFAPLYRMYPLWNHIDWNENHLCIHYEHTNNTNNNTDEESVNAAQIRLWDKKRLNNFWFESNNGHIVYSLDWPHTMWQRLWFLCTVCVCALR